MSRRTKIVATIGPASESEVVLKELIEAGMDVARIGLAHQGLDTALDRYHRVRTMAAALGRPVGILVDLPGPKVRSGPFPDGGVHLADGDRLRLAPGDGPSSTDVVHVGYRDLLADVQPGDTLGFGDGAVSVEVVSAGGDHLDARVLHGGRLQGRPGVHIPSDRLRLSTPTREDLAMLDAFVEADVDMVALSFVRSAHDVRQAGVEPHPRGPLLVAKIETRAAVDNLDGIIQASGAVMVARGDLGVELPIEEVPHLQKAIVRQCIALGRPVITATQMLESMVHAATPTRAEASDIANAVFDGSSALMLSGETAIGDDPAGAVATMGRIAARADSRFDFPGWARSLTGRPRQPPGPAPALDDDGRTAISDAMSLAAWRAAYETGARAIVCITQTGETARAIARLRPEAPIIAFSPDQRTVRQLALSWGVDAHLIEPLAPAQLLDRALEHARFLGDLRRGDLVAVLSGSPGHEGRYADTLRLVRVP